MLKIVIIRKNQTDIGAETDTTARLRIFLQIEPAGRK